jgi:hypothetical protein
MGMEPLSAERAHVSEARWSVPCVGIRGLAAASATTRTVVISNSQDAVPLQADFDPPRHLERGGFESFRSMPADRG